MDRLEAIRQHCEGGGPIRRIDMKYLLSEVDRLNALHKREIIITGEYAQRAIDLTARAEAAEAERDACKADLKSMADWYRDSVCDDGICGWCKQDADHGLDGDANECAGFYKNDCFEWRGQEAGKETAMQTINEVKAEIESKTAFRFMYGKDCLDKDVLRLVGLPSKCEITMNIGKYHNGEAHISVSGSDKRDGYGGFSYPTNSIDEAIKHLKFMAERYGWEQSPQTSLF